VGFVLFYGTQVALNAVLGLGEAVDVSVMMQQVLPPETLEAMTPVTFLVLTGAQSVLFAPLVALLIAFGEEYGWRGYLQDALIKLGRIRGIVLLGVIWGLWHAPIIAMGHNYPGYPLLGILLMTLYCVGLSFVLGYVVFKSGSVLLAAYLHALNNQVLSFLYIMVNTPRNPILSFGAGVYGLLSLTVVVALLLRDPVWRAPLKGAGNDESYDPLAPQAVQSVNPTPDGTA
jgi:membrane protease YdiL (CAAX protease family)